MPLQRAAPFAEVDPHRTGNTTWAETEMPVKPPIFRRDDGVLEIRRNRGGRDLTAELVELLFPTAETPS